jgi:hypothetical protein
MITIAWVFCAFVYALFEKREIFQRPRKLEKISFLVLLVITSIFSYVKEHSSDVQHDRAEHKIDILQGESLSQSKLIDSLRGDNRSASEQLAAHDRHTIKLLAQYGLQMDSVKDAFVHTETPPTLAILNLPTIDTAHNNRDLKYNLQSLNADAHLLYCYYVFINLIPSKSKQGMATLDTPYVATETGINFTHIIPPNSELMVTYSLNGVPKVNDEFFMAMEFGYKSKGNRPQTPVRKVYRIIKSKGIIYEADNDVFVSVSKHLKKWKIWSKFYDL